MYLFECDAQLVGLALHPDDLHLIEFDRGKTI